MRQDKHMNARSLALTAALATGCVAGMSTAQEGIRGHGMTPDGYHPTGTHFKIRSGPRQWRRPSV